MVLVAREQCVKSAEGTLNTRLANRLFVGASADADAARVISSLKLSTPNLASVSPVGFAQLVSSPEQKAVPGVLSNITPLSTLGTLQLIHAGASRAQNEKGYGAVSFWKKYTGQIVGTRGDRHLVRIEDGREWWVSLQPGNCNKDGSISFLRNLGGPRADQLEIECAKNSAILDGTDVYFGINTVAWFAESKLHANKDTGWQRWIRRRSTTRYLNAIFVDFDFHGDTPTREKEMLAAFEAKRAELAMPEPNIIMLSGRGIWGLWLIAEQNGDLGVRAWPLALDNWLNVQSALVHSFGQQADVMAKDAARITRVPGSINSRSGTRVLAYLLNPQRHTIEELAAILKVKSRRAAKGPGKSLRHQIAARTRLARLLEGLGQIVQHVWNGRIPQNFRRNFLWVFARAMFMAGCPRQAIREKLIVLAGSADPPLDTRAVDPIIDRAFRQPIDWSRSFSYEGLFSKFNLMPKQQELITAWVRPRVDKAARRATLKERRDGKKAEFDCQVGHLRALGLTRREIATKLDCSPRTVATSLTRLGLTKNSVPWDVQGMTVLLGTDAKHPSTPALEKFAHFGTQEQQRRRRLIRELSLLHAPVRTVVRVLHTRGLTAGLATVWRDLQAIRAEDIKKAIAPVPRRSYLASIDNPEEDDHVAS